MDNTFRQAEKPTAKGYGPTSFWLQDPAPLFGHLNIRPGMVFLDAGCGAGEYSLYAAPLLGEQGSIIALDNIRFSIEKLVSLPAEPGTAKITGHVCDITAPLPVETRSVDIILLSTVLHIKKVQERAPEMFREFHRVLRLQGTLAVLECKKVEADFGPPLHSRLSENQIQGMVTPCGFQKTSTLDTGHANLICFSLA